MATNTTYKKQYVAHKRFFCQALAVLSLSLLIGQCSTTNGNANNGMQSTQKQPVPNRNSLPLKSYVESKLKEIQPTLEKIPKGQRGVNVAIISSVEKALAELSALTGSPSSSDSGSIPSPVVYGAASYLFYRLIIKELPPEDLFKEKEQSSNEVTKATDTTWDVTPLGEVFLQYFKKFVNKRSFPIYHNFFEETLTMPGKWTDRQVLLVIKKRIEDVFSTFEQSSYVHEDFRKELKPINAFVAKNDKKIFNSMQVLILQHRLAAFGEACSQVLAQLGVAKIIGLDEVFIKGWLQQYRSCTSHKEYMDALSTLYALAFKQLSAKIDKLWCKLSQHERLTLALKGVDEKDKLQALLLLAPLVASVQFSGTNTRTAIVPEELFHHKKGENETVRNPIFNTLSLFFSEGVLLRGNITLPPVNQGLRQKVVAGLAHIAKDVLGARNFKPNDLSMAEWSKLLQPPSPQLFVGSDLFQQLSKLFFKDKPLEINETLLHSLDPSPSTPQAQASQGPVANIST